MIGLKKIFSFILIMSTLMLFSCTNELFDIESNTITEDSSINIQIDEVAAKEYFDNFYYDFGDIAYFNKDKKEIDPYILDSYITISKYFDIEFINLVDNQTKIYLKNNKFIFNNLDSYISLIKILNYRDLDYNYYLSQLNRFKDSDGLYFLDENMKETSKLISTIKVISLILDLDLKLDNFIDVLEVKKYIESLDESLYFSSIIILCDLLNIEIAEENILLYENYVDNILKKQEINIFIFNELINIGYIVKNDSINKLFLSYISDMKYSNFNFENLEEIKINCKYLSKNNKELLLQIREKLLSYISNNYYSIAYDDSVNTFYGFMIYFNFDFDINNYGIINYFKIKIDSISTNLDYIFNVYFYIVICKKLKIDIDKNLKNNIEKRLLFYLNEVSENDIINSLNIISYILECFSLLKIKLSEEYYNKLSNFMNNLITNLENEEIICSSYIFEIHNILKILKINNNLNIDQICLSLYNSGGFKKYNIDIPCDIYSTYKLIKLCNIYENNQVMKYLEILKDNFIFKVIANSDYYNFRSTYYGYCIETLIK